MNYRYIAFKNFIVQNNIWRSLLIMSSFLGIIHLGQSSIYRIIDSYDGLCPDQGAGVVALSYSNPSLAYCQGIGGDVELLGLIVLMAAIAVPISIAAWWNFRDNIMSQKSKAPPRNDAT